MIDERNRHIFLQSSRQAEERTHRSGPSSLLCIHHLSHYESVGPGGGIRALSNGGNMFSFHCDWPCVYELLEAARTLFLGPNGQGWRHIFASLVILNHIALVDVAAAPKKIHTVWLTPFKERVSELMRILLETPRPPGCHQWFKALRFHRIGTVESVCEQGMESLLPLISVLPLKHAPNERSKVRIHVADDPVILQPHHEACPCCRC